MADFTSLKQTIQSYVKQNGNEEITGSILQDVLLAMVTTMGDSAINGLASALQDEIIARQNQDGTLQGNITAEATARQQADTALGGRIDGLQTAINGINTKLAEGYIYAGIATPSASPGTISGKVFYIAVQAGTYANFGGTVVTEGITILKYNGSAWSSEQIIVIDAEPTKDSHNLVESGGVFFNDLLSKKVAVNSYNNVIKDTTFTNNKQLDLSTGALVYASNYNTTDYIPIYSSDKYYAYGDNGKLCLYDKDGEFITDSGIEIKGYGKIVSIPNNACFARLSTSSISSLLFHNGDTYIDNIYKNYLNSKLLSLIPPSKINFLRKTQNLFDICDKDVSVGVLNSSGVVVSNSSYFVTGFIEIEESEVYVSSDNYNFVWYDGRGSKLSYSSGATSMTAPTGAKFIRLSALLINKETFVFAKGSVLPNFAPAYNMLSYYLYKQIGDNELIYSYLKNEIDSVTAENISEFKQQNNLFDINSPNNRSGYLNTSYNNIVSSDSWLTTHYISVVENETIHINIKEDVFYCFVDDSGIVKGGGRSITKSIIAPSGSTRLRLSFSINEVPFIMVYSGNVEYSYERFGKLLEQSSIELLPNSTQLSGLVGSNEVATNVGSLSTGESLTIDSLKYPTHVFFGETITCEAKITSFSEMIVGKGYESNFGHYFKIDGTNITQIKYQSNSEIIVSTTPHNLNIDTFIKCVIQTNIYGVKFILSTLDGIKTIELTYQLDNNNGQVFVHSNGSTLTDVKLSAVCCAGKNQVWMFGDSYFSFSSDRWTYYLKEWGFADNILFCAQSGANSVYICPDMMTLFSLGYAPKYLVWCLGMNDTTSYWNTYGYDYAKALCAKYGVTLILATIPSVPSRDKTEICTAVKNSGYRYIDFAKAVNGEIYTADVDNWYGAGTEKDYLEANADITKRVHPTDFGAKALASQVLIDFPEILQFCLKQREINE